MQERTIQPKKGDRYEVTSAFTVAVLTKWKTPFTGGYERPLPAGLQFIVERDPPTSATAVNASPEPYARWEPLLVDAEDLAAEKYSGYYVVIPFDKIEMSCLKL